MCNVEHDNADTTMTEHYFFLLIHNLTAYDAYFEYFQKSTAVLKITKMFKIQNVQEMTKKTRLGKHQLNLYFPFILQKRIYIFIYLNVPNFSFFFRNDIHFKHIKNRVLQSLLFLPSCQMGTKVQSLVVTTEESAAASASCECWCLLISILIIR